MTRRQLLGLSLEIGRIDGFIDCFLHRLILSMFVANALLNFTSAQPLAQGHPTLVGCAK